MNRLTKTTISLIAALILAFGCLATAVADTSEWGSKNKMVIKGADGIVGTDDDIVFDAEDLDKIYDEVSVGKAGISNAINDAGLTMDGTNAVDLNRVYTFAELCTGVNPWKDISTKIGKTTATKVDSGGDSFGYTYNHTGRNDNSNFSSVNSIESLDEAIARDNISFLSSNEAQSQLGSLGYINFKAICSCDEGNTMPSAMNITIKYMDGLQNKWQMLTSDDFLVVTDIRSISNVRGDINSAYSSTTLHSERGDICNYELSYDSSTGKLTFRQPYLYISGLAFTSSTDYYHVNLYKALPCTVYYKSSEMPVAP